MNYINAAEEYLRNYRHLKGSIGTMRREMERLLAQAGPSGDNNMAVAIDAVGGGRGGSGEYDETVNILWRVQELMANIIETEKKLEEVDVLLEEISRGEGCEFYGAVLRKWYVNCIPKDQIAEQIGYESRTSIYTIKNRAIRKFAVRVLGIRALESI